MEGEKLNSMCGIFGIIAKKGAKFNPPCVNQDS